MATEPFPRYPVRLAAWLVFVLIFAALSYASRLGGDTPDDLAYRYETAIAFAIQGAIVLGILLLIARSLPRRDAFALRQPASWGRAAGLGFGAIVAIWLVSAAASPFLNVNEEQGLVPDEWNPSRAGAFVAFFASTTIIAPVVEELTFRGLGFTLLAPYGAWVAAVATSVLFAAAHGLVVGFPLLAVFGMLLAWLRAETRSVYPPILLHASFNAVALTVSVTVLG